jgi:hypothetical protein
MSTEVLQATLDLVVLRTFDAMGAQHGFGLAKRILQVSEGLLDLNQGTLYPPLLSAGAAAVDQVPLGRVRQQPEGEVLRAHPRGRRQIREETASWELTVALMAKFLAKQAGEP